MQRMLLMTLLLPAIAFGQSRGNNNIVVVVDASGSMGDDMTGTKQSKMSVAKDALKSVLLEVDDSTNVGILVFGNPNGWVYPLGKKNPEKISEAIDRIQINGSTPLGTYMKKGADALLQQRMRQRLGSYKLIVVTDGNASGNSEKKMVKEYTPDILSRGIVVEAIGVDMAKAHTLATMTRYREGSNPDELLNAMKQGVAEIGADKSVDLEEEFDIIASLDPKLAQAMITAITNQRNHPIGEKPRPKNNSGPLSSNQSDSGTPDGSNALPILGGAIAVGILIVGVKKAIG